MWDRASSNWELLFTGLRSYSSSSSILANCAKTLWLILQNIVQKILLRRPKGTIFIILISWQVLLNLKIYAWQIILNSGRLDILCTIPKCNIIIYGRFLSNLGKFCMLIFCGTCQSKIFPSKIRYFKETVARISIFFKIVVYTFNTNQNKNGL